MFDCDTPVASSAKGSVAAAVASARSANETLSSVSYALVGCGATVLCIAAFIEPSKIGVPIIVGYSFILAGIAALAALMAKLVASPTPPNAYKTADKVRIGMMFFSIILLTTISLSMYSKYKSQIKSGNVPQFSIFSALISLFICMQLYEMFNWLTVNTKSGIYKVTATLNSTLLLYKLITYILIICLTISLKYYITDG
jgi:hypothetical protein